ncbi:MAG: serine/threonine protein kinase with repeat [Myxococcales bacterium]|nr:serine/threonine protein kinase with repeat [Myxococcales bacterium]
MDSPSRPSAGYAATIQRASRPSDEEPPYESGTVLSGRYQIQRRLGEGGMGRVYEAEHMQLGRRVAVKVMRRKYAEQKAMVERFRVEARSASRIGHPNVVQVFDFGTTEAGEGFIVMELLDGAALSDVIKQQGAMDLPRVLTILGEVATALRAAHDSGVIHRDLKPANIFLIRMNADERERVRVLDFGMAKLIDLGDEGGGLTAAGEILGTPEYMAPEQAVGGEVDRRIDVYALGCVAYEMWTGQPPFSGPNYVTVLAKHMDEKAPRISDVRDAPPALDHLIARSLAKNPDDRPADMGAVLTALQRIAEDEGVSTAVVASRTRDLPSQPSMSSMSRMSSTKRRFTRMNRRTRRNLGLGIAALALLGAGALAEQRFGPPPPPKGAATVVLATTPAGATVKVDGRELADRSPAVTRLDPGKHDIEAVMPHYITVKIAGHEVAPAATEVLRMPMARDTYRLQIASEPGGAQVYLDGFAIGTTPMEYEVDPWDQHTLRLERLGRKPWEKYLATGERPKELRAELKKREAGDAE